MTEATPHRVGIREFRGNLTGYLRQARQGTSFLITSHDEVIAEIRPPSAAVASPRKPGSLRGRIRLADDFDRFPTDILSSMEGVEEA